MSDSGSLQCFESQLVGLAGVERQQRSSTPNKPPTRTFKAKSEVRCGVSVRIGVNIAYRSFCDFVWVLFDTVELGQSNR